QSRKAILSGSGSGRCDGWHMFLMLSINGLLSTIRNSLLGLRPVWAFFKPFRLRSWSPKHHRGTLTKEPSMKRLFSAKSLLVAAVALGAAGMASAHTDVVLSLGVNAPYGY